MRKIFGKKTWLLPVLCIFFSPLSLSAQDPIQDNNSAHNSNREEFWISPLVEINMYSISSLAIGGGVAFAYGDELAIGLKTAWFTGDSGEITTLEINILLRWNILGSNSSSGPFIQVGAGPVLFTQYENMSIPADLGSISAGASFGWRLPYGPNWFIEPTLRIGFPFILGAGISGGYRF